MTPSEWIALAQVLGTPAAVLIGGFVIAYYARKGTSSVGSDVSSHIDQLRAELTALGKALERMEERRVKDIGRLQIKFDEIIKSFNDYQIAQERRIATLETMIRNAREGRI